MPNFSTFLGPSYTSQSPAVAIERLMNLYCESVESPAAKAQYALYPTPGLSAFATLPQGPVRGLFAQDGRMWAVGGNVLYEVLSDGSVVQRGLVARDNNPVTFASNGDGGEEVFVTSGDVGYVLNTGTDAFATAVSDVTQGGFLDGYFLALDRASSTLKISDLLTGTTWDPTQIAQRTMGADKWVAMLVSHREFWLFGTQTSEVWGNVGTFPFPFGPVSGLIQMGIAAPFSAELLDSAPVWLGQSADGAGVVFRANGYTPQRISNHAVEFAIQGYLRDSAIDDAIAFTYQDQGHSFYILNFPSAGATWCYDATTDQWHERGYFDVGAMQYEEYRPRFHAHAFGKNLVGDRSTGTIYVMDITYGSDADGAAIRRLRRSPHVTNDRKRVFYHRFQLDLETGLGLVSGQGSDPTVMARFSRDGGKTWGNEHWKSAGAMGNWRTEVRWDRVGMARDFVVEVVMTDGTPLRIANAFLDVSQGNS